MLRSGERKKILAKLEEQFGIEDLRYALFRMGRERINGYSGHLSIQEIITLAQVANIDKIGLYLMKEDDIIRLGFDATQTLGPVITKDVFDLDGKQAAAWMAGYDLEIKGAPKGILVMRHNGDYLGCAKSNGEKIINHVPKERRIKNRNI